MRLNVFAKGFYVNLGLFKSRFLDEVVMVVSTVKVL